MKRSKISTTKRGEDDVRSVDISKVDPSTIILAHAKRWDDLFLQEPRVSDDFTSEREQPPQDERAPL